MSAYSLYLNDIIRFSVSRAEQSPSSGISVINATNSKRKVFAWNVESWEILLLVDTKKFQVSSKTLSSIIGIEFLTSSTTYTYRLHVEVYYTNVTYKHTIMYIISTFTFNVQLMSGLCMWYHRYWI
jgi:ribosomal protein L28